MSTVADVVRVHVPQRSYKSELRAIKIVWTRELIRFRKDRMRIVTSLIQLLSGYLLNHDEAQYAIAARDMFAGAEPRWFYVSYGMNAIAVYMSFCCIANSTGQPAISLPLHWNGAGLPIGTMFTAACGNETVLLRLAAQLEEARPWRGRRPPIWG